MSFIARFLISLSPVLVGVVNAIDIKELPPPAKHEINFKKEIWPLLKKHCVKCHGPEQQKSGYRIDDKELAFEGGEMGEAIIPGDSAKSPLVHFISGLDEEITMPPKEDPLDAKTVGIIRAWIDQGAEWPDDVGTKVEDRMDHWAFRQILHIDKPKANIGVDGFIKQKLESKGLKQQD